MCVLLQASGYGSGDDTYDDTETTNEVKKVVEERKYPMVRCSTHAHISELSSLGRRIAETS